MTDTLETIGKTHRRELPRDAIHVAVLSVKARQDLEPGQRVSVAGMLDDDGPGIVDPFLEDSVFVDDWFWMFMNPGSIQSLRHEWVHPSEVGNKAESEAWLKDLLKSWVDEDYGPPNYERFLEEIAEGGYVWAYQNTDAYTDKTPEFWRHVETVLGKKISQDQREETYFRCGC